MRIEIAFQYGQQARKSGLERQIVYDIDFMNAFERIKDPNIAAAARSSWYAGYDNPSPESADNRLANVYLR